VTNNLFSAASTWASDTAKTDEEDRGWYKVSYKTWLDLSNEGHDHLNVAGISVSIHTLSKNATADRINPAAYLL
jgi:hypothetical protein